jgi:antitoxin (DNA-binding transcriptional repressor) of toxin-antitoxin stability system
MKTATVRQVRHDFGNVISWVQDGESVAVSKRGEVIAIITPPPIKKKRAAKRPDFAARMKRIFGDKVFKENTIVMDRNATDR